MPEPLTHFDDAGASRMVDVGAKPATARSASASGLVRMAPATLAVVRGGQAAKGDVLGVARLAGIMAAKRAWELIPLCHPLPLDSAAVDFGFEGPDALRVECRVTTTGRTGVEMEALTGASVAALTVYDMCKSIDRGMAIESLQLEHKDGGRSGPWRRPPRGQEEP